MDFCGVSCILGMLNLQWCCLHQQNNLYPPPSPLLLHAVHDLSCAYLSSFWPCELNKLKLSFASLQKNYDDRKLFSPPLLVWLSVAELLLYFFSALNVFNTSDKDHYDKVMDASHIVKSFSLSWVGTWILESGYWRYWFWECLVQFEWFTFFYLRFVHLMESKIHKYLFMV